MLSNNDHCWIFISFLHYTVTLNRNCNNMYFVNCDKSSNILGNCL